MGRKNRRRNISISKSNNPKRNKRYRGKRNNRKKSKRLKKEYYRYNKYENNDKWQNQCIEFISDKDNVILSSPTGSGKTAKPLEWITGIRQMESAGQVMGLNETINTTTAASSSGSNSIDVHMLKNTEYGAIVLLGASNYGKQGSGEERYMNNGETITTGTGIKASTTGNVSGVYEIGRNNELVAGVASTFFGSSINTRYYDSYTVNETSAKVGDATVETKGWHVSNYHWFNANSEGFYRSSFGAFSYGNCNDGFNGCARAGVVNGSGF